MRQALKRLFFITLLVSVMLVFNTRTVNAQAGTASDLINGVNALRESQGLAPYSISSYLMSFAQTHSDYMASLGTWTHTRADGTTAFDYGIKENVAMGTNMSISYCIYTVWSDWTHWQTMVGYSGGTVGAGVAIADNIVYYTLNVLPEGGSNSEGPDTGNNNVVAQETIIPISPVATVTPDEDGIIIHTVQYGETLWSISQAYGVSILDILSNSGLSQETTEVYEGQTLLIQKATEPSPTPSPTATEDPGTATPTQPRATLTPYPTRTPAPTQTPTSPPSIFQRTLSNGKNVGLGLILVSGLGLILVIYLGFLKKSSV
jgi:LysM repeat protein